MSLPPDSPSLATNVKTQTTRKDLQESLWISEVEKRFEPFPLTPVQHAYWIGRKGIIDFGEVSTHHYHEIDFLKDSPSLDLERFERAWNRLIEAHEMLRCIIQEDGQQRILAHVHPYHIHFIDQSHDASLAQEVSMAWRGELSHQVLPSKSWPLFEVRALQFRDRLRLFFSLDLLVVDGWSFQLLFKQLLELYLEPEKDLALPDISFRDYVNALEGQKLSPHYQRAKAYWLDRLPSLPNGPQLPIRHGLSKAEKRHFERREFRLDPQEWKQLKAKAQNLGITPTVLLLTAFAETLGRWSESPQFSLNLTHFNRQPLHPNIDQLAGDFTSLLILEVKDALAGDFASRGLALQEQLFEDLDHRELSGVELLRERAKHRKAEEGMINMPIVFTSILNHEDQISEDFLGGIRHYSISQTPQVWLDHMVVESAQGLHLTWDAVEALFLPNILDEMFKSYQMLIFSLIAKETIKPALAIKPVLDNKDDEADEVIEHTILHNSLSDGELDNLLEDDWFIKELQDIESLSELDFQSFDLKTESEMLTSIELESSIKHEDLAAEELEAALADQISDLALSFEQLESSEAKPIPEGLSELDRDEAILAFDKLLDLALNESLKPAVGLAKTDALYQGWSSSKQELLREVASDELDWQLDKGFLEPLEFETPEDFETSIDQALLDELFPASIDYFAQAFSLDEASLARMEGLIHQGFFVRAKEQPDRVAVVGEGLELSYHQLAHIAESAASSLIQQAQNTHDQSDLIAVVMHKGWEQLAAVLAILRAGFAYVPIDAHLPKERIKQLLDLSQAKQVITQSELKYSFDWPPAISVHSLKLDPHEVKPFYARERTPQDLAYVIFTSGTTGVPKGVAMQHEAVLNTLLDINERFKVSDQDSVLAISSLSFDLSVWDIFGIFLAGGKVIIPKEQLDSREHLRLMKTHQISLWNSVPALLSMLLDFAETSAIPESLRLVMLSGDWIPLNLPSRLKTLAPQAKLYSLGGATEAAIWSIYYPVETIDPNWRSIPYGKALKGQAWRVLNSQLENCPTWVTGELYIGGLGLAREYWGDAEKTDKSFIIHPKTGERLYKTGDLGRLLPDGNIELLGRVDRQVKIRGHRIELGEIEATLRKSPQVREAIALAQAEDDSPTAQKSLVAYVLPKEPISSQTAQPQPTNLVEAGRLFEALKPYQADHADPNLDLIYDLAERQEFKTLDKAIKEPASERFDLSLAAINPELETLFKSRRSQRRFSLKAISSEDLSAVMAVLRRDPLSRQRLYASAGDLYPVQLYLYIKEARVKGLKGGAYYYDPARHGSSPPHPAKPTPSLPPHYQPTHL
ncbi:MAG: amino acid adenylation domain-containing protein [Deinococcales bacterium]